MTGFRITQFLLVTLFWSSGASALNCNVAIADMVFGDVPTLGITPVTSQSRLTYRCEASVNEGGQGDLVTLCVSINSGGVSHYSSEPVGVRKLFNGTSYLAYDLFADAGRSLVWGSNFDGAFGSNPPTIHVPMSNVTGINAITGSGSLPIYGRVFGFQTHADAGSYMSQFGPGQVQVIYDFTDRLPDCNAVSGLRSLQEAAFTVSARVAGQCKLAVAPLNFGQVDSRAIETAASTALLVSCVTGTPYQISLGPGNGSGATVDRRLLTRQGGGKDETISYGLYQDPSHARVWGDTLDINTLSGIANGAIQKIDVFGKIVPQAIPGPGIYLDTVVVTVTF